jgi:hypothetical protein
VKVASRQDFNDPPTPVGGIPHSFFLASCRLDLKYPPTPVGGIPRFFLLGACRSDPKYPQLPLGVFRVPFFRRLVGWT